MINFLRRWARTSPGTLILIFYAIGSAIIAYLVSRHLIEKATDAEGVLVAIWLMSLAAVIQVCVAIDLRKM
jgi:hypothetical protein